MDNKGDYEHIFSHFFKLIELNAVYYFFSAPVIGLSSFFTIRTAVIQSIPVDNNAFLVQNRNLDF